MLSMQGNAAINQNWKVQNLSFLQAAVASFWYQSQLNFAWNFEMIELKSYFF